MMRWTWDGVATINALCPVGDFWLQSRLTAVDLPRGVRRKELTSEKKCPAAIKERKKDYWTSKSVAHARITGESRSQSRSTPSAVLEDTMHLAWSSLFLSAFAPSSMRSIDLDDDRTSGRAAVRGRSARSRWELKMRDRVFLQGRVTVVAILFRSVLTAHALFHTNEDPMRVLMLNPPPPPPFSLSL